MHHLVVGFLVVVAVLSQKMRFPLHATDLVQGSGKGIAILEGGIHWWEANGLSGY
jgi:hypothetical protein